MCASLKSHSIHEIKETISAALSTLCKEPVEVTISSFADTTPPFSFKWNVAINAEISKKEI